MKLSGSTPGLVRLPAPPVPAAGRRPWVDQWLETCRDLQELKASHPMMDAVIDEILFARPMDADGVIEFLRDQQHTPAAPELPSETPRADAP